jgi:hypothetical protein
MLRIVLLIILGLAVGAFCFTPGIVLAQDADPDVNYYVEPSTNPDGTALEDLESCTVTVTDPYTGAEASTTFPASSPAGGAMMSYTVTGILGTAKVEGPKPYPQVAYCVDTKGNTSVASNVLDSKFPAVPPLAPVLLESPAGP